MPPQLKATLRNSTNATNAVTEVPKRAGRLDREGFPRIRRFAVGVDEELDEAIDCPFHILSRLRATKRRPLQDTCEGSVTLLVLKLRAIVLSLNNSRPQSGTCCAKMHDTKQALVCRTGDASNLCTDSDGCGATSSRRTSSTPSRFTPPPDDSRRGIGSVAARATGLESIQRGPKQAGHIR